jgi:hypothetical protein
MFTTRETKPMGVDIYLKSVWEPFWEKCEKDLESLSPRPEEDPAAWLESMFAYYESSGGYLRNAYNASDVMWAMGMSWKDVYKMLDKEGRLPIECARKLVAAIEERPLTDEQIGAHVYKHMTGGINEHPVSGAIDILANDEERLPPDFEVLAKVLREKREALLAILRKSIELNEPLLVT